MCRRHPIVRVNIAVLAAIAAFSILLVREVQAQEPNALGLRPILEISQPGRLHEIAVFTARGASGAAAMPVIGLVRGDVQVAPAASRAQHSLLNRRFRLRRIASNRGIRA